MCGKITCKVKPLIIQDHFLPEVLYYLGEGNSVKYNASEVSESLKVTISAGVIISYCMIIGL